MAPKRRLLIRPGAIGDFIVSLPALEHLRAAYTEVWTSETNLPLVRFADAKTSIISSGLDWLGHLPTRLREFDSIVSWYGANRPDFRELVQGLPFEFHEALPHCAHAVDFYCAQVGAPAGAMPRIDVGPAERHGRVILHPFASSAKKRWPYSVAELSPLRSPLVTLRGPEEFLPGALFIPDLLQLAQFIAGAKAYIGADSGITHLAAAVGAPTIALFGPTDPFVWAPRGPRVKLIKAESMAEITPQTILSALEELGID